MYLFVKRLIYVLSYFKDLGKFIAKTYINLIKRLLKLFFMAPDKIKSNFIGYYPRFSPLGVFKELLKLVEEMKNFFIKKKNEATFKVPMKELLHGFLMRLIKALALFYNIFILI